VRELVPAFPGSRQRESGNKLPHSKTPGKTLISLSNCSIILDGKPALDDASFALRRGERWALVGPNGSGKTLLLKLLRGDMWPTPVGPERREYCFDGEVSESPIGAKERIAYVGPERQDRYVRNDWNHTVTQVVTTGLFDEEIPRTRPSRAQTQRVVRLLKTFKLWSLRDRGFLTLSYGQRRRALVARAFVSEPEVLLLDEVFNGLDTLSASILRRVLNKRSGVCSTWIVTTHRAEDVPGNVTNVAQMRTGGLRVLAPSPLMGEGWGEGAAKRRRFFRSPSPQPSPTRGEGAVKTNGTLIQLRNVDLYRDYRLVLRNVSWTIRHGEHWAIFGRNGSGKSTLLKLLYGDLHPKLGGEIVRDGMPFGTPISEWKRRVGFVSPELQADYFSARDLEEVVISGRYSSIGLNDAPTPGDRRVARRWLKFFGIADLSHRKPREVSYGQMRLALIARAMMNNPRLLLLDEPCTGLDTDMHAAVIEILGRLAQRGTQVVMAVHRREDVPACVTHRLTIERNKSVRQSSDANVASV